MQIKTALMQLPQEFVDRTRDLIGIREFDALLDSFSEPPPVSIRVNDKTNYSPSLNKVAWCDDGYYLPQRPLFTADPWFHGGVYYVQEASSMFLAQVVTKYLSKCRRVLDLCAAPGGKSTLLLQYLASDSLLVSNEINRVRSYILAENIIKWGQSNVIVTNNDPADFSQLTGYFDAVVVDAPCSGEGMFRKDVGAISEWSVDNVAKCVVRQRKILTDMWDALQEDGILIYSTCTFNRQENEENVLWMCTELGAELIRPNITNFDGIVISDAGYRFYPHKIRGEGLFLSVIKKTSGVKNFRKIRHERISPVTPLPFFAHLKELQKWTAVKSDNKINAFARELIPDFLLLSRTLRILQAGITLGELKGRDIIPSVSLALSKSLDILQTEIAEVDEKTALSFLRSEAIFATDERKGYLLIVYKNIALGWVKNVGNRWNNLYPQEWRIRMKL